MRFDFELLLFGKAKVFYMVKWAKRNAFFGNFFLVGGFADHLEKWSISSPIRVQIAQELVRLITLIGLNKFLMHIISPKSLKKFSWTTFRWSVLRKCEFLVVLRLL